MRRSVRDLPEGWLAEPDIDELRRLGAGKVVLELGAYQGRSTIVLSEVAKYVVSVDRHQGVPVGEADSLPAYLEAIRPLRNVAIVVANFEDFVPLLGREWTFGLVFIDGQHEYDEVIRDITLALLVDPPVVAFHDYDFDDVKRAATEVFGDPDAVKGSVASYRRFL